MSRPTRIAKIIPDRHPATNCVCYAPGSGMGGVHFVPTDTKEIPPPVAATFSRLDLSRLVIGRQSHRLHHQQQSELTGSIAHNDILA